MSVANVLGVPHAYELTPAASQPETLVFVHGWLLSRCYWQPTLRLLSPRYRCLTYDLRGFGDSTRQLEQRQTSPFIAEHSLQGELSRYGLAAYAEDLLALLQQFDLRRVWLVGHSLGGSIALWAAHLAPQQVEGVICLNAGGGIYIRDAFIQFRSAGQQMIRLRAGWLQHVPLLSLAFANLMVAKPLSLAWGRQRLRDLLRADAAAARASLLASTAEPEVHYLPYLVSELQQPAYFVTGTQDKVMEPRYVRHLASFHRGFRQGDSNIIELAQCGHFAMLEQTQQVAKLIQSVLEAHRDAALGQPIGPSDRAVSDTGPSLP
ncbi:MAG: alpha/beta hydrolase [Leptolyngbya sp. SIO4C1]|nr:alpha/beta hydrolase [Leptolyngbya sp. SIO4C1]